jgi:small-conductance mechanosensitive channel
MTAIILLIGLVVVSLIMRFVNSAIKRVGKARDVNVFRIRYICKTVNMAIGLFGVIAVIPFLGVEYSQVSIFLSSVFAVIGVALFAQWSILSNITASLVIFFGFPYRVGDHIRVLDKDDDISGIVEDIALFHVLIRRDEELITYPNSLILQKGVVKNPKSKAVTFEQSAEQTKQTMPVNDI